jgi:Zn-dependent metalloprotease
MDLTRKLGILVLLVATLGLGAAASGQGGQGSQKGVDPELIKSLKQTARGSVSVTIKKSTKFVGFVRSGRNGDLLPAVQGSSAAEKASAFLRAYGGLFGVRNPNTELITSSSSKDSYGATHLSYEQTYKGVPVFGAVLRAHVDSRNDLTAVNGVFVPGIDLSVTPRLSPADASARAIAAVIADPPRNEETNEAASTAGLSAASTTLYVYRTGLIRGVPGSAQLVYQVEVTNGAGIREFVFVHANAGKIVNRYSAVNDALFRRLFEQNTSNQVWQEGDAFPGTLNIDQQHIVTFSGEAYFHFMNAFGRDSYDGAGHEMRSVNNDPTINCPNANWNGSTTNYCTGVTADDVVAHEWGHAYTQYTDNLIYQWQPGALNESYSDIWGETVDLVNGEGTDSPGAVRSVGSCSSFTTPIPQLIINSPPSIAGECPAAGAQFGPALTPAGVTGNVVLADDGAGTTSDACTALVNGGAIAGNIALVDRGICTFVVKVKNAQNAGATAVIVANTSTGAFGTMGGSDPTITIPSVMTTFQHGNLIKGELANGVNATLKAKGGPREDSYRWLIGEDATAFNPTGFHAIRDMWNPTCLADPGKVTDAEYQCAPGDGGGVHTNSGVPNHGYALLVDGGTYNGHTVAAIGFVKAAHLYWRAQSVYQTPTTGFDDHADALEASCNDLIGAPLEGLSVTSTPAGPSGQSINAADCASVSEMIAAVELRTDPAAQCNFQPLLKQNPPALCSATKNPPTLYQEGFEAGLGGWTLTNQGVYSGWPGLNWVQATSLPGGRAGSAAYGADPDIGNCDGGAGDVSGVMRMQSPAIHIPVSSKLDSYRLTFEHYVATEAGWDGGNVKISINGGAYTLVPASAFLFNAYNTTLNPASAGNTDPLAGEPAFSGTDGGQVHGSWGQSQINLVALGVKAGDTIRLRFDNGMDGCTGVDGWYIDDVKVRACNKKKGSIAASPSVTTTAKKEVNSGF